MSAQPAYQLWVTERSHTQTGVFDVIKIDIEGAEKSLFDQEMPVLQRFRFGVCEWHTPMMTGRQLHAACTGAGFEVLGFASQGIQYDLRRGDSLASPLGMFWWRNPVPVGAATYPAAASG